MASLVRTVCMARTVCMVPARGVKRTDVIADIGFQPGLGGRTAAALVGQRPGGRARAFADEPGGFSELRFVRASPGHGHGNAVGGVDQVRRGATVLRQAVQGGANARRHRFDESRMMEKGPDLVDLRGAAACLPPGILDVFQVLPAVGPGTVGGGDERQRPTDPVRGHPAYRIRQQGMPVPVPPVDRKGKPAGFQRLFQGCDQRPVLSVDRADAAEVIIVFRDLHHAFSGYAPALEYALEKRDDIGGSLGAPKGYHEQRVVVQWASSLVTVQQTSSPQALATPESLAMPGPPP